MKDIDFLFAIPALLFIAGWAVFELASTPPRSPIEKKKSKKRKK